MSGIKSLKISGQVLVAIALIFGMSTQVQAASKKAKTSSFQPTYKVERCDCFGYSDNVETFLSDLEGGHDLDIFGEGKSLEDAAKNAHRMCVEHYRGLAGASYVKDVTETGCEKMRSTPDGDWVSI